MRVGGIALCLLVVSPLGAAHAKDAGPKKYKSCDALNKDFPLGVAKNAASVGYSYATVNAAVFELNKKSLGHHYMGTEKSGYICARIILGSTKVGTRLVGANMVGFNLAGANLYSFNLTGANLTGANLNFANLASANLTGANLTGTVLYGANLLGANLAGANLTGTNLRNATMPDGTKNP